MVQGVRVKPEVTGVNHPANWCIKHDAGAAGDRVRDAHQFDEEFANFEFFVGVFVHSDGFKFKTFWHRQAEVGEDFFNTANSEFRAVNRRWELGHDVWQTADVVQVAMGDDVGPQLVAD